MNENPDDIKNIWIESGEEHDVMNIEKIRTKADNFANTVKWRNIREYGAAIFVIVMFAYYAVASSIMLVKIGSVCNIAASLFIVAQLRKRSASTRVNPGTEPILSFHRKQLERERNSLRSVWAWYVLPTVPGSLLLAFGVARARPDADAIRYFAVILLVYIIVLLYNAWGARQLQREIDALSSS
jgi:hypothetical protein